MQADNYTKHLVTLRCGREWRTASLTAQEIAEVQAYALNMTLPETTMRVHRGPVWVNGRLTWWVDCGGRALPVGVNLTVDTGKRLG